MAGPQSLPGIVGRQQNTISLTEKIVVWSGVEGRPELIQTLVDLVKASVSSAGVKDYSTITDMVNGGSDIVINNEYLVLDASGHASITSGWAKFKYQGGGKTDIGNYRIMLAEEWFDAAFIDYDNSGSSLSATKVKAALDELDQNIANVAVGLKWKSPAARVATTGNITLSGEQTIDDIAVVTGDTVLVRANTANEENGIYDVDTGAWTRRADADTAVKLEGAVIGVLEGTVNADKIFQQTQESFTLDTDPVIWEEFSGNVIQEWTETIAGKVEKATKAEAETGGDATEGNRNDTKGMTPRKTRALIDFMNLVTQDQLDLKLTITAADDGYYYPADSDNTSGFFATLLTLVGNTALTFKTALDHIVSKIKTNITNITNLQNDKADKSNVLELDNTDAFTPDADYEPATKKYVDENSSTGVSGVFKEYPWTATAGQTDFEIGSSNADEIFQSSSGVFVVDVYVNNAPQLENYTVIDGTTTKNTIRFDFGLSSGDKVKAKYWHKPNAPVIPVGSMILNVQNLQKQSVATSGNGFNTGVVIQGLVHGIFEIIPGGPVRYGKNADIYASSDGGTTAHSQGLGNIPDGATVYWNGNNNLLIGNLTTDHYIKVI